MAWTAPMTAVATAVFTATQFNTYIRDNLLETAPAKATDLSNLFSVISANTLVERTPKEAIVTTPESTASTSYTALATAGPAITVTTTNAALVLSSAKLSHNTLSGTAIMSFAVSGSTTIAAADSFGISFIVGSTSQFVYVGHTFLMTGLTEGSNTFTAQYKAAGGTATFADRRLNVLPL